MLIKKHCFTSRLNELIYSINELHEQLQHTDAAFCCYNKIIRNNNHSLLSNNSIMKSSELLLMLLKSVLKSAVRLVTEVYLGVFVEEDFIRTHHREEFRAQAAQLQITLDLVAHAGVKGHVQTGACTRHPDAALQHRHPLAPLR